MRLTIAITIIIANCTMVLAELPSVEIMNSPWGICAHPHRTCEYNNLDREIHLMQAAGIKWVREDFQFAYVCARKGKFQFELYDKLIERFQSAGIQILPILQGYGWEVEKERPDIVPLYKHIPEWKAFVRAVVSRYHNRIKHWEIWNEEDGGFWRHGEPNAKQYVKILKAAYEEIKSIDLQATVIVGGLCGFHANYLSDMYAAGAKPYFNAIAVHPYGDGPDKPSVLNAMKKFANMLKVNGDGHKPIWITECGGSTYTSDILEQDPQFLYRLIKFGLETIKRRWTGQLSVAIVNTNPYGVNIPDTLISNLNRLLPNTKITIVSVNDLNAEKYPVIIWHCGEVIPEEVVNPLLDYISEGGLLVTIGRIPFYYISRKREDGTRDQIGAANLLHPKFRISYRAWWTTKNRLPKESTLCRVNPKLLDKFFPIVRGYTNRYLGSDNLKPGDKYIPIVQAVDSKGSVIADEIAMYTFADRKGAIIVSIPELTRGYTEDEQANLYQRIYLAYLSMGIKKLFAYDMHNDGRMKAEKEHNFGIVDWYWRAKPAYYAYQAMTAALGATPKFVTRIKAKDENLWLLVFKNVSCGKTILDAWSTDKMRRITVSESPQSPPKNLIIGNEVIFVPIADTNISMHILH